MTALDETGAAVVDEDVDEAANQIFAWPRNGLREVLQASDSGAVENGSNGFHRSVLCNESETERTVWRRRRRWHSVYRLEPGGSDKWPGGLPASDQPTSGLARSWTETSLHGLVFVSGLRFDRTSFNAGTPRGHAVATTMSASYRRVMRLSINGETKDIQAATVAELVTVLELPSERVAIEHNGMIVRRADRVGVVLADGDRIEIVTLVGGG